VNEFRLQKLLKTHVGLSETQLADLNHEAVKTESPLEQVVISHNVIPPDRLYQLLSKDLNLPYIDLTNFMLDPEVVKLIPADVALDLQVLPLYRVADTLAYATANPDDIGVQDRLRHILSMEVSPVLADPAAIRDAVNENYRAADALAVESAAMDREADEALRYIESEEQKSIEELAGEAPVIRFVNALLEQAMAERSSDIHIEPEPDSLRVRLRTDGLLRETGRFPERLHAAVSSRVKILSGMDISDKRRPQDGRFDFTHSGRQVDVRVSTFPTVFGENLVLRLLDKSTGNLKLTELGMDPQTTARFEALIRQPHGIILVTGPTGSGKTTTLYSVLNVLNSEERNIITLEDPVEYHLKGVRQCQVNPKAGITFASGLRSILRQDPDVILVGEIRDAETAEIAFQAALTGHLVLSTLHTNDAASSLTRMIDMNVEPFLIASSVIGILAQRLVRRICERCRIPHSPLPEVLDRLDAAAPGTANRQVQFCRGSGCSHCARRGYRGRAGIYELMSVSPEVRRLVMERRSSEDIKTQAVRESMQTLRQDAVAKALSGITTPEEVLRVTQDQN
jgi:type IV pilus assembly protein PilB